MPKTEESIKINIEVDDTDLRLFVRLTCNAVTCENHVTGKVGTCRLKEIGIGDFGACTNYDEIEVEDENVDVKEG